MEIETLKTGFEAPDGKIHPFGCLQVVIRRVMSTADSTLSIKVLPQIMTFHRCLLLQEGESQQEEGIRTTVTHSLRVLPMTTTGLTLSSATAS